MAESEPSEEIDEDKSDDDPEVEEDEDDPPSRLLSWLRKSVPEDEPLWPAFLCWPKNPRAKFDAEEISMVPFSP